MTSKNKAGNAAIALHTPNMSRYILLFVVGLVLFSGAGCANTQTSSTPVLNPMQNQITLKTALEQAYEPTRQLTTQPTPDAFFAAMEPSVLSEQTKTEMRQGWKFASVLMKDMMPPLDSSNLKFYKTAQAGDWAGYYYAYKTDDGITSFAVRRFHQTNNIWKVADFSMVGIEPTDYESMPADTFEQLIQEKSILRVTPPAQN